MNKIKTHILHLISLYISGEINEKEFNDLENWLNENSENKNFFTIYLFLYKKSRRDEFVSKIDGGKSWNEILIRIKNPSENNFTYKKSILKYFYLKRPFKLLKYAALLVSILGVSYFYLFQNKVVDSKNNQLLTSENNIILELESGKTKVIDIKSESEIINKSGNIVGNQIGNLIDYKIKNNVENSTYNTLKIPYGKKFQIILSDGTRVFLNSGSSLKYPVKFLKNQDRQVYLLNGEAYFDVTKDSRHPFIVTSNNMNLRVLGTKFDIYSYPEDKTINTVLVNGSVSLYKKNEIFDTAKTTLLTPNHKASWNKTSSKISIQKVDTSIYTGWKEGKLIFKNISFYNILKKLERHYNVTIINNNKELEKQYFNAAFDLETIDQVLNSFNKSFPLKYTIKNNHIIIY